MDTYDRTAALPAPEAVTTRTPRILVIDDDRYVRTLLCDLLEAWGYVPDAAADGREGLTLFERGRYDVVLTDLGMPGMTGLALAKELKRRRAVPVLLLTGWADELDAATAPSVDLVVAKPFTRERLFEALAHTLPDRVRPA